MVHSIYPSASTGAERVCLELAGSFAIQEAEQVINCGGWRRLCLYLDKLDRKAGVGRGGSAERKSRPWESTHPPAPAVPLAPSNF